MDDGLLCGPDQIKLLELISQLSSHLDITARDADFLIGLKIDRDRTRRVIHLSQEQYTNRILRRFEMLECNSKMQPVDPYMRLPINEIEGGSSSPTIDDSIYREAVGSLMFLMV